MAPTLTSIDPTTVDVAAGTITLHATGDGFTATAVVEIAATAFPTVFVWTGQVDATVDAATLTPGAAPVTVRDGAEVSAAVTLTVTGPVVSGAVTWVTVEQVEAFVGVPVTDTDELQASTDAANTFAYRRRQEAGYVDDPNNSPGPDASRGTVIYAGSLYRERGSVDSFSSFEAYATNAVPLATFGQVLRLLGIPKPQFDRPYTDSELQAYRARLRHGVLRW